MPTDEELRQIEAGKGIGDDDPIKEGPSTAVSKIKKILGFALSWGGGWGMAEYFRVGLLLIPGVAFFILYACLSRILHGKRRPFLLAIALQSSHLVWMVIGGVVTRQYLSLVESALIGCGIAVVLWRPGWRAALPLGVYNLSVLPLNLLQLFAELPPQVSAKSIQLHILIRVGILAALAFAVRPNAQEIEVEESAVP